MIGGENLICYGEIPLGKDLLIVTPDERLVVFSGHGRDSFLWCRSE
jgi:hypothetical protein